VEGLLKKIPEVIRPERRNRQAALPPLGLIPAGSFGLEELRDLKSREKVPVHVVFPMSSAREADNVRRLLAVVRPLRGILIDDVWIAFGGPRPESLGRLQETFPELRIFPARRRLPPDQVQASLGKGATMRGFLYHLITVEQVTHPRAVIEFIDADIRPAYFHSGWVLDPVGAILWFSRAEAAKVVYERPRGGRLNAMVRALLALCPHPEVQGLQKLAYVLSGEMAGTLHFWTSVPFKSGYGVEILMLLSAALNRLGLAAGSADLEHLVQVYVGRMDHRHAPVTSTPGKRGLDQMAAAVFHTLLEVLVQAGLLSFSQPMPEKPLLSMPFGADSAGLPRWMETAAADQTLAPLGCLAEVEAALAGAEG
jgi:hypothetical protein